MYEYIEHSKDYEIAFRAETVEKLVLAMANTNMVYSNFEQLDKLLFKLKYKIVDDIKYIYLYEGSTILSWVEYNDYISIKKVTKDFILNRIAKI